ncbi:MAG TPA: saccharopine dehydrogenase NADP-binding domain-containing protein [Terriglobales bacterium]
MMPEREFDVVLYGATGFTGRQTVRYFAEFAPPDLKWAIAGRNLNKLKALKSSVPVIVADSSDQTAIDTMVRRTRVLLTTAGPFALYGTGIVDACVRFRTHYCDITGETPWVRGLIDRYQEKAAAEGTRLIPFSGFDSVPSDLGAMLIAGALGPQTVAVKAFFQFAGGLNGGTLASALNMAESGADKLMRDPFLLSPQMQRRLEDWERDPTAAAFDENSRTWMTPFVMSPINTRVVRRSCQILAVDFAYQEYLKMEGTMAGPLAVGLAAGSALLEAGLHFSPFRQILRMVAPAPGGGPSEKTMDNGWFRCELVGCARDGRIARALIADKGDPGNRVTVKCLCESALALALDELPARAGFLTPSTGLGDALVKRLRHRGMELSVS